MLNKQITGFITAGLSAVKALPAKTAGGAAGLVVLALSAYALAPFSSPEDTTVEAAVEVPAVVMVPQSTVPQPAVDSARQRASTQSSSFSVPNDYASLTRKLQGELKQAGCYRGPVNGSWNAPTRRAMKAFTEQVNAVLPVDKPDEVLLALIEVNHEAACAAPCDDDGPAGSDDSCGRDARAAAVGGGGDTLPEQPAAQAPPPAEQAPAPLTNRDASSPAASSAVEAAAVGSATPSTGETPTSSEAAQLTAVAPVAAATVAPPPEAADEALPRRAMKRTGPVPSVGVYERNRKRYGRRSQNTPSRIAKSFVKSVQKAFNSAFNP